MWDYQSAPGDPLMYVRYLVARGEIEFDLVPEYDARTTRGIAWFCARYPMASLDLRFCSVDTRLSITRRIPLYRVIACRSPYIAVREHWLSCSIDPSSAVCMFCESDSVQARLYGRFAI
jgi:hypothetical protein